MKLTSAQKKKAIEAYADTGTLKDVADIVGVSKKALLAEMKRSKIFGQKMKEAGAFGRASIADDALSSIINCGKQELELNKTQLTANIALANAYAPDFKTKPIYQPTRQIFNVITGIPRPKYKELPAVKETDLVEAVALTVREEDKVIV